jgi:TolA-binding protein
MMPIMKNGILGDAYADKGDFAKALEYYEKASKAGKNDVLAAVYLKKLGQLNDMQGNKEAAAAAFERLRTEFPNPNSPEWREVEKYIYKSGAGQK